MSFFPGLYGTVRELRSIGFGRTLNAICAALGDSGIAWCCRVVARRRLVRLRYTFGWLVGVLLVLCPVAAMVVAISFPIAAFPSCVGSFAE